MRYDDIYVMGIGRHLPDPMETADAEERGLCARKDVWRTGIDAVCVAEEAPPVMAVDAARQAMADAGADPSGIELILHASVHYQGHDLWPAASYVQREAVGNACPAVEVGQQSNGGMAAIGLAAGFLAGRPAGGGALVSTGDRFALPGFDRWRTDPGTICGDGGTAMVLTRRTDTPDDGYKLRSAVSVSDPGLEKLGRGTRPFSDAPLDAARPIDAETPREQAVSEMGFAEVLKRLQDGQVRAVEGALSEAGVGRSDVAWFVLPHLGLPKMKAQFFEPLGIDRERTTWDWGSRIGHLGAGDQIAGLGELVASGRLAPGERCLLAGVGAGFTWSAAVVERTPGAAG